ncbi:hypothetical protein ABOZ73_04310 [Caulobacter sp. 73W]|uniref:Calcium-binding protein n=1 Tax=Caulobacter sp. 73W TaxID=3161137 RepID=A0AB39KVI6_9CAUL
MSVTLRGGSGVDTLEGGAGDDYIYGYEGNDILRGGDGRDMLWGGQGDDILDGGAGADTVHLSDAYRPIRVDLAISGPQDTGEGRDTLLSIENVGGGEYDDIIRGDGGVNNIGGAGGNDLVDGRAGNDVVSGGAGDDEIYGGDGDDMMHPGSGNDLVYGGAGNDVLWVAREDSSRSYGHDVMDGGDGADSMQFATVEKIGVTIDLSEAGRQEIASGISLTIRSVENFYSSWGDDHIFGTDGDNTIAGYGGNDVIDGRGGFDTAYMRGIKSDYTLSWTVDGWLIVDKKRLDPSLTNLNDGTQILRNMESLKFYDGSVALSDGMTELVGNILRTFGAHGSKTASDLSVRLANERINAAQALAEVIAKADATTTVATMSYQFFTGSIPTKGGVEYLVAPDGGNANNLNSAYFQSFNLENRYINFAVNLGRDGEGKAAFQTNYGALSLSEATKKAYAEIFGRAPTDAQLATMLSGGRDAYFATYGSDGLTGLGTKAAMVGWLLAEAAKADVGVMARSNTAWLTDLADGSAPFAVNILSPSNGYYKAEFVFGG